MAKTGTRRGQVTASNGPMVVDPRWLLKAGAVMLVVAFCCGYATLCWLFYQGQWQLVLHPVRTAARPATIGGAAYQVVRFGPDSTGVPQRTAWLMPAEANDRYRHLTVLYLPSGDGSLNDALPVLNGLRQLGIQVVAVSYRGYGESADVRPNEAAMREDAEAAWTYLVQERKVKARDVVPFGTGVGASLALGLSRAHAETAAVILQSPRFDVLDRVRADPRVRFLPVERLLHDRFDLEPGLAESKVPKLIFSEATKGSAGEAAAKKIAAAGDPKMTVEMEHFDSADFDRALGRFLDVYAPPTPAEVLLPDAGPTASR